MSVEPPLFEVHRATLWTPIIVGTVLGAVGAIASTLIYFFGQRPPIGSPTPADVVNGRARRGTALVGLAGVLITAVIFLYAGTGVHTWNGAVVPIESAQTTILIIAYLFLFPLLAYAAHEFGGSSGPQHFMLGTSLAAFQVVSWLLMTWTPGWPCAWFGLVFNLIFTATFVTTVAASSSLKHAPLSYRTVLSAHLIIALLIALLQIAISVCFFFQTPYIMEWRNIGISAMYVWQGGALVLFAFVFPTAVWFLAGFRALTKGGAYPSPERDPEAWLAWAAAIASDPALRSEVMQNLSNQRDTNRIPQRGVQPSAIFTNDRRMAYASPYE